LAGGVADVGDVRLHGGIEGADLFADRDFHALELRADEFEGKQIAACGWSGAGGHGLWDKNPQSGRYRNPDISGPSAVESGSRILLARSILRPLGWVDMKARVTWMVAPVLALGLGACKKKEAPAE